MSNLPYLTQAANIGARINQAVDQIGAVDPARAKGYVTGLITGVKANISEQARSNVIAANNEWHAAQIQKAASVSSDIQLG